MLSVKEPIVGRVWNAVPHVDDDGDSERGNYGCSLAGIAVCFN